MPGGRPPLPPEERKEKVPLRLSAREQETLDAIRGDRTRSEAMRSLIRQAAQAEQRV